jgi:hypothetical protein
MVWGFTELFGLNNDGFIDFYRQQAEMMKAKATAA